MEKNILAIVVGIGVFGLVYLAMLEPVASIVTPTFVQERSVQIIIGGDDDQRLLQRLASYMPWFDRNIEIVIVPTLTKTGVQGLSTLLRRYEIGMVVLPHDVPTDAESRAFIQLLISRHVPYRFAAYGQQIVAGPIRIRMLSSIGQISPLVVRVDDRAVSFISAMPKGVTKSTLFAQRVPKEAFAVSLSDFAVHAGISFAFLHDRWFMKCENETDLPFLQHVCTNRSWQLNEHS